MPALLPTSRSFIGIAKETTKGTPVAATGFIPVRSITPHDNIAMLEDHGLRNSMADQFGAQQGVKYSEFEVMGDLFPDTSMWWLAGVFGDYAVSGAAAPYYHTAATKNSGDGQATAYTITDYNAFNARQYAGSQLESVDLKFNPDGLLEYTAKCKGYASATASTPTPSFSTVPPTPSWSGAGSVGGVLVTNKALTTNVVTLTTATAHGLTTGAKVVVVGVDPVLDGVWTLTAGSGTTMSWALTNANITSAAVTPNGYVGAASVGLGEGNLTFKRASVDPVFTVQATQNPYQIFQGAMQVSGSLTFMYEDDTFLNYYLNNTQPRLGINWQTGATVATTAGLGIQISQLEVSDAKIDRGKSYVTLSLTVEGLANTVDVGASAGYGPAKVQMRNTVATAIFA